MPETVAAYFTAAGQTVTGFLGGAVNVFESLWSSGAPGQVMCTAGIASTLIGLGLSIFRIRGGRRRSR